MTGVCHVIIENGWVYKVIIEKDWGWSGYTREGLRFFR
jgi:hypothetical protein